MVHAEGVQDKLKSEFFTKTIYHYFTNKHAPNSEA